MFKDLLGGSTNVLMGNVRSWAQANVIFDSLSPKHSKTLE